MEYAVAMGDCEFEYIMKMKKSTNISFEEIVDEIERGNCDLIYGETKHVIDAIAASYQDIYNHDIVVQRSNIWRKELLRMACL